MVTLFYLLPLCSQRLFGQRVRMSDASLQIYCHTAHRIIIKKYQGDLCYIYKPNVVYEFTMHGHNTCFLKTTATLLTD